MKTMVTLDTDKDARLKREEAIKLIEHVSIVFMPTDQYGDYDDPQPYEEAFDMAIESLKNEPILCEDCRHRDTWDNPRLEPQYYKCGRGVKFRDYGYVREDDYCPLGERREESEIEK